MARRIKPKQRKEIRHCYRCGKELKEGNFRWCDECQRKFRNEYKDSDPISDYELCGLPSIDENGY